MSTRAHRKYQVRVCLIFLVCLIVIMANSAGNVASGSAEDTFVAMATNEFSGKVKMVDAISQQETVGMAINSFSSVVTDGKVKVDSFEWKAREEVWGDQLDSITHSGEFYDIFLVSMEGNILYTTAREADLGKNVQDISLKNQGIHAVYDSVMDSELSVSYVEPYSPSDELYSTFVARPVLDLDGNICGVFAVQIAFQAIVESIYGEGAEFEVRQAEIFNREVIDSIGHQFEVSVVTEEGIQLFMVGVSPGDGSHIGNGNDVGILSAEKPAADGDRICSKWIQFGAEDGTVEAIPVTEIYYHIWWKAWEGWAELGVDPYGIYSQNMPVAQPLSLRDAVSQNHDNGYMLATGVLIIENDGAYLNSIAVKIKAFDHMPMIHSGPSQASFIIVNPEPDNVLKGRDSDEDGLTDYKEMYETHTDPYDNDTDQDRLLDGAEYGSDPNLTDTDRDGLQDGLDDNPIASNFEIISDTKYVTGEETITGNYQLYGSLIVEEGASLTVTDASLQFEGGDEVQAIKVKQGGTLNIERSTITLGSAFDWFINIERWLNWNEWDHIVVSDGNLNISDSTIRCASILFVKGNDECIIEDSRFSDMFYAVRLADTDAVIRNTVIDMSTGYGLYLTDSEPLVEKSTITMPIGTALYCANSSPQLKNCQLLSLRDVVLDRDSHPIIQETDYESDRVQIMDGKSSIVFESGADDSGFGWKIPIVFTSCLATVVFALLVSRFKMVVNTPKRERSLRS